MTNSLARNKEEVKKIYAKITRGNKKNEKEKETNNLDDERPKDGNKEDAKNFKTHYEEETDFHTCAICGKESGMNHLKKIDEK